MENKKKIKDKKDSNKKSNLYSLEQFIIKNKKENLAMKKILEKMNQSSKKDERSD